MHTRGLLLAVLFFTTVNIPSLNASERIEIVSDSWINFVNTDGSGYYLDLLKLTFPSPEYELNITIVPYSRALHTIKAGKADIVLGIWANEYTPSLLSQYPVEADILDALMRKNHPKITNISSFNRFRVIAKVGYGIDELLDSPVSYDEHISLETMIKMILYERADVLFDYYAEMNTMVNLLDIKSQLIIERAVLTQYAYFGFCSSARCSVLKQHFDERFLQLHKRGTIKNLLLNNKQPLEALPPLKALTADKKKPQ
ncbi:MAG: hypothetical protein JKY50_16090 [Oleispira sp.]|nr:hypothetical protein [Oleispira sp.]